MGDDAVWLCRDNLKRSRKVSRLRDEPRRPRENLLPRRLDRGRKPADSQHVFAQNRLELRALAGTRDRNRDERRIDSLRLAYSVPFPRKVASLKALLRLHAVKIHRDLVFAVEPREVDDLPVPRKGRNREFRNHLAVLYVRDLEVGDLAAALVLRLHPHAKFLARRREREVESVCVALAVRGESRRERKRQENPRLPHFAHPPFAWLTDLTVMRSSWRRPGRKRVAHSR